MLTKEKSATSQVALQTNPISDYNTYQGIYKLVGEITTLAAILTDTTEADVFVRYSGHIKEIEVSIHLNGWRKCYDYDINVCVCLDPHCCLYNFKSIERLKVTLMDLIDTKNHYLLGGI